MSLYLGKEKIENVSCGLPVITSGIDTSDATASADDILTGKTAYVKGQKITGNIDILNDINTNDTTLDIVTENNTTYLSLMNDTNEGYLVTDAPVTLKTPLSNLGNAQASDVASGKTFTSQNGLKLIGTASTTSSGTNTSDATAAAGDIVSGKTAYVKGNKITGTLDYINYLESSEFGDVSQYASDATKAITEAYIDTTGWVDPGTIIYTYTPLESFGTATPKSILKGFTATSTSGVNIAGTMNNLAGSSIAKIITNVGYKTGATPAITFSDTLSQTGYVDTTTALNITTPATIYGDASASDVASGKTFTSINGLKITGTATASSGTDTSDATAAASDILSGKTAYVNGSKITGTISTLTNPSTITASSTTSTTTTNGKYIQLTGKMANAGYVNSSTTVKLQSLASNFGTATAADVAFGKTFTSAAGLKITGTKTASITTSNYGVYSFLDDFGINDFNTQGWAWSKPTECAGSIVAIKPVFNSEIAYSTGYQQDFIYGLFEWCQNAFQTTLSTVNIIYDIDLSSKSFLYINGESVAGCFGTFDSDCAILFDDVSLNISSTVSDTSFILAPAFADTGFITDYMVIYK